MPEKDLVRVTRNSTITLAEALSQNFYAWEKRGRGWSIFEYPVAIEPPFRPFFHYAFQDKIQDDGRTPGIWDYLQSLFQKPVPPMALPPSELLEESEPDHSDDLSEGVVELQISVSPTQKSMPDVAEQFLLSLGYLSFPASFEIVGLSDRIVLQIACKQEDLSQVRQSLRAFFPESRVQEIRDSFMSRAWAENQDKKEAVIADFGLSQEFMLPLSGEAGRDVDSLGSLIAALDGIRAGELGLFQVLFKKTAYPWAESVARSVTDWEGRPFFANAPQFFPLAKEKIRRPLFAAVVRVACQAESRVRAWEIVKSLGSGLIQFSNPLSNEFIPLSNEGYPDSEHADDVVQRRSRRSGLLLNSEELSGLIHLPSVSVRSEKLRQKVRKTKMGPATAIGHETVLGENEHNGRTSFVSLSANQRVRHTYVVGASGTGKSQFLLSLILQDIRQGRGAAVLDPHGDLIDQILANIPDERRKDVILFDPSDAEYPIGFNILSAHSELDKNLLSSDLVAVFRRLSTSWGDQMNSVLANAILAFLESDQGGTLIDLRRFLIEKEFRQSFLSTVKDPEVVYYWQKEFPLLQGRPQAPILTRLDTFLRPKPIRYMVSQKENKLDFGKIMNGGKLFLAKLAQGSIGEENAHLLGTFLVSKFQQTALSRQELPEKERQDFFLYIDEFQHFITPSMSAILSGARKYRIGLVLAHQELRQLKDQEMLGAVLSNAATRICFRLGDDDAKKLSDGFSSFEASDLQNLGVGEAIGRIERAEYDFSLSTTLINEPEDAESRIEAVRKESRERYATKRDEVDLLLAREPANLDAPAIPVERPPAPIAEPRPGKEVIPRVEKLRGLPESPGRGGQRHKYLQHLVKQFAEEKGYRAEIEKAVLDGAGSVDVALEKNGKRIACEISVTTDAEHELGNIGKCLAAGFEKVVFISSERKAIQRVKALAEDKWKEELVRISFLTPEEFLTLLDAEEAAEAGTESTVKGYKVKTNFRTLDENEKNARKQSISQTILKALKRLRGE